jgi:hypothetical protein
MRSGDNAGETQRVVTTAIALMLFARNIYGDRIEGGGNRLVPDLDQCMDEPPMIGFREITQKEPTTMCRCMAQKRGTDFN